MEKYILQCGRFISFNPFPGVLLNLKQKAYLLAAVIILLLLLSVPASAAVVGILAQDSDGSYHHYCYQDLIDSQVNNYWGEPDGLYKDYSYKWPVALLDSVNGYVDIDYAFNEYVSLLLQGQPVTIDEITERPKVKRYEVPKTIYYLSVEAGELVRQEKQIKDQGGADNEQGSDTDQEAPDKGDDQKTDSTDKDDDEKATENSPTGKTELIAGPTVTISQAQQWAKSKNAHQRFIDIAPLYWEYGEKTGIRPEVLYAQAAYETGYGHYSGQVPASFNNWAGIKVGHSNGDNPEDHEIFATPEEGVRGHFNHISAYVGLQPVGEPHDRYYSVKSIAWAGTVEFVEELSGKWAPSSTYHEAIVRMIVEMN